ncbi:hypothetical protein [Croceibacter atlanticus]|jgi:uncharacterized BrkB/YihY/UPF0761 family membrane protein|uniref:Acid phosphatase n=1 Tax=Croceibacter atlanticus (strain ATCC BAA-628 / JCM 21780 / CIP 108009 / IAM 15332 / KCTC 12090 / HTCC2559) TaxID=216432 RepID=A3U738_CROAH|nr:hypothetical protein [Croceibacter atlanticus]EAP88055.1 acid phosphatase [Croceibacter atlanticus HTCC2559]WSP35693.1 hypothetical protein VVL01_06370 [Croceibacter atlanticus]|tara:strand:- start:1221 stop:1514 length:294 start_codon:yes stop_codon:yes gene_type:complete
MTSIDIKKELLIGFVTGLIATCIGTILYILIFSNESLDSTFNAAVENEFLGSLIALGAVANFFPFFVFLKKKKDHRAKGVLIVSLMTAIAIAILKFG